MDVNNSQMVAVGPMLCLPIELGCAQCSAALPLATGMGCTDSEPLSSCVLTRDCAAFTRILPSRVLKWKRSWGLGSSLPKVE